MNVINVNVYSEKQVDTTYQKYILCLLKMILHCHREYPLMTYFNQT